MEGDNRGVTYLVILPSRSAGILNNKTKPTSRTKPAQPLLPVLPTILAHLLSLPLIRCMVECEIPDYPRGCKTYASSGLTPGHSSCTPYGGVTVACNCIHKLLFVCVCYSALHMSSKYIGDCFTHGWACMLLQDISCLVGALGMQHGSTVLDVIW